ncbi:MAG: ASCH domain-containing protein [Acidilobaceae archaeon]
MLKGEFADLLLEGKKKTTIRLGRVIPKYREVIIHSRGRPLAKAEVVRVEYKTIRELTEEDALNDGFNSLGDLLKALRKMYSLNKIDENEVVSVIELKVVQKFSELDYEHPYLGLSSVDVARIALRYLREELSEREVKLLETIAQKGSLRKAALEVYGSLEARRAIRPLLRRLVRILKNRGLIGREPGEQESQS